jgi:hypothetical protein
MLRALMAPRVRAEAAMAQQIIHDGSKYTGTRWLFVKHLQKRYGDCSRLKIDRMIKKKRLSAPEFPFGNSKPAWRESVLDEDDNRAVEAATDAAAVNHRKAIATANAAKFRKSADEQAV